jgi:hypothetical protein
MVGMRAATAVTVPPALRRRPEEIDPAMSSTTSTCLNENGSE